MDVSGIHHVTAIAGIPGRNLEFYTRTLVLRLVKKTVNFDDPTTYHLYYGDGDGTPGTIITFFPWAGARRGRVGAGQLSATSFSIPSDSLAYWKNRLSGAGVTVRETTGTFGEAALAFADPDGLPLELTGADDGRAGWEDGPVPAEHAIRGFHHVTLLERDPEVTGQLLKETLGFRLAKDEGGRARFAAGDGTPGCLVDVLAAGSRERGLGGVGTVHHVAFRVPDEKSQLKLREEIAGRGYGVTPVLDRNYFRSVYFREPGGVLFEIATDPPGFTVDEPREHLGEELKLPPWLEPQRESLQNILAELPSPAALQRTSRRAT
jgi:glyoxalase family protein